MKLLLFYSVILLLTIGLLWFFWRQLLAPTPMTPVAEKPATSTSPEATEIAATTTPQETEPATSSAEQREIEGVFLSLQEMDAEWRTGYTYLLLDDGTEIFRIDLRPLLGNTTRNVAEQLDITRGQRIRVSGTVSEEGGFRVQAIDPVSPTTSDQ